MILNHCQNRLFKHAISQLFDISSHLKIK
jgi:hypothetical protein